MKRHIPNPVSLHWLQQHWSELDYDVPSLPDVGTTIDGQMVTGVDRLKGEYWFENGHRVAMPRIR